MNIDIANRLLQLRRARGYSQEELADRIGISRQSVSKWERAEASPDTDNLIALARLYGVSLDELLLGLPPRQETEDVSPPGGAAPASPDGAAPAALPPSAEPVAMTVLYPTGETGEWPVEPSAARRGTDPRLWLAFPYPVLVTIAFLLLGFLGGWWHPAWILFLTVPLYYSLVDILVNKKSFKHFLYPVLAVIVFLVLGFCGWWHPGWLVFLTIPLYYALFPDSSGDAGNP